MWIKLRLNWNNTCLRKAVIVVVNELHICCCLIGIVCEVMAFLLLCVLIDNVWNPHVFYPSWGVPGASHCKVACRVSWEWSTAVYVSAYGRRSQLLQHFTYEIDSLTVCHGTWWWHACQSETYLQQACRFLPDSGHCSSTGFCLGHMVQRACDSPDKMWSQDDLAAACDCQSWAQTFVSSKDHVSR